MRTQLLWSSIVDRTPTELRPVIEGPFRDTLRAVAMGITAISGDSLNSGKHLEALQSNAWPIWPSPDDPESGQDHAREQFLRAHDGGGYSLAVFRGDGSVIFSPLGGGTTIEVYSHQNGAEPHILPLIAMLKTYINMLGQPVEVWALTSVSPHYRYLASWAGLDVAESFGQVVGVVVLENLLKEIKSSLRANDYYDYMSSKGVNRIAMRSSRQLVVSSPVFRRLLRNHVIRWLERILGLSAMVGSLLWLLYSPGFEPLVTALAGTAAFAASFITSE